MPGVMAHSRQPLDDCRHAGQGPEIRAEAVHARSRAQRLLDRRQLLRLEPGLAPGAARRLESGAPMGVPGVIPVMRGHRRDPQGRATAPCDVPLANSRAAWNRRASNAAKSRRAGVAMLHMRSHP